jgi:hypothetical protein
MMISWARSVDTVTVILSRLWKVFLRTHDPEAGDHMERTFIDVTRECARCDQGLTIAMPIGVFDDKKNAYPKQKTAVPVIAGTTHRIRGTLYWSDTSQSSIVSQSDWCSRWQSWSLLTTGVLIV